MGEQLEIDITSDAPGAKLFLLGNEAIARGAIEAGVQFVAAYPGTPSSEVSETLVDNAAKTGMYAEWSVNEKVALEVAIAAAIAGLRAVSVMKHVGVNVAHDALNSASYMGVRGGFVLVSSDDPGQLSSQNEQDNRYIGRHGYIPVFEPSSVQEAKDMMAEAIRVSEEFGQIIMLRSVTRISHARSDVVLGKIDRQNRKGNFVDNFVKWVCLPGNFRVNRRALVARMEKIKKAVETLPYNRMTIKKGARLGVIASGISYSYTMEAIQWLGLEDKISVLKIGTPYPLPSGLVKEFLNSVPEVLVVEELEPFVEDEVKVIAKDNDIQVKIQGKGPIPLISELSTRLVAEALSKHTGAKLPVDFAAIDKLKAETAPLLPIRPPSMCAGCPHRATFYAINAACKKYTKDTDIEPLKIGDIGCYALGANPPLDADDIAICMGGAFGLGCGFAHTLEEPIVAHLGDSTFFHSGIAPMINAVYNKANMVMVIMDNATTGMTGFQPHPGASTDIANNIKIEDVARACGVKLVEVVDSFDLPRLTDVVDKAIRFKGPSVIVARRLCNILNLREKKKLDVKIIPYEVNHEKCVAGSPSACQATCPLHIDIRGYIRQIKEGKFDEALAVIKQTLPFPGIIGRVCPRPCEGKCERGEADEPSSINALKRAAYDYGKYEDDYSIPAKKNEKIAIIGAGPAGLIAAYDLRKAGNKVTIFEAMSVSGGMMAAGIPEFRLPRNILQKEIDMVKKLGVEFKLNIKFGKDITISSLKEDGYKAVFIATGLHENRSLDVENENSKGILRGVDFLRDVAFGKELKVGAKVLIIGSGNVAIDVALTALRKGGKNVSIVCLENKDDMPAWDYQIKEAREEGVKIINGYGPNKFIEKSGKLSGVVFKRCTCVFNEGGDFDPKYDPKDLLSIDADTVIVAIGQAADLSFARTEGIAVSPAGRVVADPVTLETSVEGVFAGGDIVSGPATVIQALASGRKAAVSIHRYLKGERMDTGREGEGIFESKLVVDTCVVRQPRIEMPMLPLTDRHNFNELELGLSREDAVKEAKRCLSCDCYLCINLLGCPAIIKDNGKVMVDASQCPGCNVCAQVCPHEAIQSGAGT